VNTSNTTSPFEPNILSYHQTICLFKMAKRYEANNEIERKRMIKIKHSEYGRIVKIILFYGFLGTVAIFYSGCSSSLKLSSTWQQENIIIDGIGTEWQRGLYYDKKSDIVYGIRNDDEYVYVLLKTQDRITQRQIMRAGFTVWFDANGGDDRSFGIRYPLAKQDERTEYTPDFDNEQVHSVLEKESLELEIVGAQKEDIQRFSTLGTSGIRIKIGRLQEALVYELKVPLKKTSNTPFAVGVTTTQRIGIGFETEEFSYEKLKAGAYSNKGLSENAPGDLQIEGGDHEGRGYNGGGRQGGMRQNEEKPGQIRLWLSVQLAIKPN
jgi:hypothetical protein